jgi:Amt family ammonium transporter
MVSSLCVVGVAAIAYCAVGFAWQGYAGLPAHVLTVGGKPWSWIAAEPFLLRGLDLNGSPASLSVCLEIFAAGLAALIPLGAGGDRWRLGAVSASTVLLCGFTYPVFSHWAWGGGWLAQLGVNYGLGHGFLDAGGGGSIQSLGGLTALAMAWLLGPRKGKYTPEGMPLAIPGHNAPLVLLACLLALIGWIGLNGAGALLFASVEPGQVARVVVTTTLAAAAAAGSAAAITRVRFGKPDASLCANGWVGGLASISAGCAFLSPAAAILIGLVAGALVVYSVELFELHLGIDDPGGSISVHAVAGIWGVLALGLFAPWSGQLLAQVAGVSTLFGFVLPLTYGLNWLLDRFYHQRVGPEGERQGMDLYELGAGAYPEFVSHNEDFFQR